MAKRRKKKSKKSLPKKNARKSFLNCPHARVQQFTECCLDCGYNIYTTMEEYLADLKREAGEQEVHRLEKKLGIK